MNIKLKFKKNILIGLIVATIPASLNAAWYHSVATSFKENIALIASVAVGATALLGTALYVRSKYNVQQDKNAQLQTQLEQRTQALNRAQSILDRTRLSATAQLAMAQMVDELGASKVENQRLTQEIDAAIKKAVATASELNTNKAQLAQKSSALDSAQKTIADYTTSAAQLIQERDAARADNQRLNQVIKQNQQMLVQKDAELATAQQKAKNDAALLATATATENRLRSERNAAQSENKRLTQAMESARAQAQAELTLHLARIAQLEKAQVAKDRELGATRTAFEKSEIERKRQASAYEKNLEQLTKYHNDQLQQQSNQIAQRTAALQSEHDALIVKYNGLFSRFTKQDPPNYPPAFISKVSQRDQDPAMLQRTALASKQSAAALPPSAPPPKPSASVARTPAAPESSIISQPVPIWPQSHAHFSHNPFTRLSE